MAGYVRSLESLSDYETNHTLSLYGFHVTALRRTRQGFSSLSPNYNPANDCTSYTVRGENEYSSIASDTYSFRSDE